MSFPFVGRFDSPLAMFLALFIFRSVVALLQLGVAIVVAIWDFPFVPTPFDSTLATMSVISMLMLAISIVCTVVPPVQLIQLLVAVVVAIWNSPFVPSPFDSPLTTTLAIFILRAVTTPVELLQLLLAIVVAVWNFPFVPIPLQFWLVVLVAFINIRFVATPLHFLMTEWSAYRSSRLNLRPLRFCLVVFVAFINIRFVATPLRFLTEWSVFNNLRLKSHPLPEGADSDSEDSDSDDSSSCDSEVREQRTLFRRFLDLPLEVRRTIWGYTLPSRVVELNTPDFAVLPRACTFEWTSKANNQAPAVAMVNREARELAVWYCTLKSDMQRAEDHQRALRLAEMPIEGEWIRSNYPLVRPEGRVTWFNKANDTVVLYHNPYCESISEWNALSNRIALYGFLAADTAVYASQVNPWPRRSDNHQGVTMASGPNVPWNDPIFVLRIVVIHAAVKEAQHSGLFGLAGDEPIQLVDPLDTNLLMEFFWFTRTVYREQTEDTVAFFDGLRANVGAWEAQVQAWRRDGLTRDLWMAWIAESKKDFAGINNPGGVFAGPRCRNGIELDMTDPASYQTSETGGPIDLDQYGPNENHPWVEDFLASLPTFRPRIQIRHCADRCVPIPEEDES